MSDPLQVVDLTRPHGFLVWRGKQQAIASPVPLPAGEVMITSDGEAFGVATLAQPSMISLSEFERESEKHCIRPEERQLLWPQVDSFYLHHIKNWQGFNEPQPIVAYEPTPDEALVIEKAKRLPKTIVLDSEAVLLTGNSVVVADGLKSSELSVCLETAFANLESIEGEKALPLYQLALVRRPTLRFVKKKEVTAMPYEINDEECVVNMETGKVEKCHDTHEEAMAHMAALNMNVEDAKAVTKTEGGSQFSRSAYLYAPGDEVSEWKLRIEASPGQVTKAQLGAAAAALSSGGFRGQQVSLSTEEKRAAAKKLISEYRKLDVADDDIPDHLWTTAGMKPSEKAGRRMAGGMMDKLRTAMQMIQELMMWGEYHEEEPEEEMMMMDMLKGQSGVAIKMVNGEPWHVSWSSNAFEDRDGEIFSLKALEQYVQENEENEVKGWFNLWHIPGTDFSEKRYQAIIGKFLFEAGPYLKDEKGQKALEFFKKYSAGHPEIAPEGWGSSVEYKYLPEERKNGVYEWVWITRTSTLPRGDAANIWTKSAQQEFIMTDKQKKAGIALFGSEYVENLLGQGKQKTDQLEEAGVANKAVPPEDVTKPEAAPTPEPEKPVETPVLETPLTDPAKLVQELAVTMQTSLNEAIAPVLSGFQQQLTILGEQFKTLSEELKQVKGEQAIKQQVELPRFTFDLIRASQANSTIVPEGDALKDKKPTEAQPLNNSGGSVVQNYFPSAKG